MNAVNIALKDLQVLVKDRGAVFLLFLLPMVFILLWGGLGAAGGGGDEEESELAPLAVVNLDTGGQAAASLIDALDRSGSVRVELYTEDQAREELSQALIWWALVIPQGFSANVDAGQQATLRLMTHPDAAVVEPNRKAAVTRLVNGVASDLSLQTQIIDALEQLGEMQAASSVQSPALNTERYIAQAQSQFALSKERPLVAVEQLVPTSARTDEQEEEGSAAYVTGFIVLFVFLAAQSTAQSIFEEKRSGSFRRLLAAPLAKAELLGGKLLASLVIVLVQIVVIFIVGAFLFSALGFGRLGLGKDPLALVLVSLLMAVCSVSLGAFIAAIARTQGQVGGVSTGVLWVAAMIGGTFVPTYIMPAFLRGIGQLTPHYWANQAYYDLLVRGQLLSGVTTEMLALLVFTVLFFAVGLWRFDFE